MTQPDLTPPLTAATLTEESAFYARLAAAGGPRPTLSDAGRAAAALDGAQLEALLADLTAGDPGACAALTVSAQDVPGTWEVTWRGQAMGPLGAGEDDGPADVARAFAAHLALELLSLPETRGAVVAALHAAAARSEAAGVKPERYPPSFPLSCLVDGAWNFRAARNALARGRRADTVLVDPDLVAAVNTGSPEDQDEAPVYGLLLALEDEMLDWNVQAGTARRYPNQHTPGALRDVLRDVDDRMTRTHAYVAGAEEVARLLSPAGAEAARRALALHTQQCAQAKWFTLERM